jgi:threonine aldolase
MQSGAWLRNATHANSCARYFAGLVSGIPGVRLVQPVEANAVFVSAPEGVLQEIEKHGWHFYTFIGGAARFMFAWDTDLARVDALSRDLEECAALATRPGAA